MDNVRFYKLDMETSELVYKSQRKLIEPKFCYNNVFLVVSNSLMKFQQGEWKVAYGYAKSVGNVFCRHCFILDTQSELIIDPTVIASGTGSKEKDYYIMKVFDSIGEYANAIKSDGNLPALDNYLMEREIEAQRLAREYGYLFIG